MNDRVNKLKEKAILSEPSICWERGKIITESYKRTAGQPQVLRRAIAFKDILEKMTITIDDYELIVGNQASRINAAPLFPEFSTSFLSEEMNTFALRPFDRFLIDDETKNVIKEIEPFWKDQTHEDRVINLTRNFLPENVLCAWEEDKFRLNDILYDGVRKSAGDGHIIPNYYRLLSYGFNGVIDEAKNALSTLDYKYDANAFKKKYFLDSVIISYEAVIAWIKRYSALAYKKSKNSSDAKITANLLEISNVCDKISNGVPENFREALQFCFFIHLLLHIESNGHSISFGRIDQYLYPFYIKDIENGFLTKGKAIELIECFYIKVSSINKVRPWPETKLKSGMPMFMTITLSGVNKDGEDVTNDLSYLFLDALVYTKLPSPTVVIRVNEKTPTKFLVYSSDVLRKHGGGLPAYFSDEAMISALIKMGIPVDDAREYAISGCSEAVIPGKTFSFTGGDCYFNLLKIFEVILNEGVNPRTGICINSTKKIEDYESIDDLLHEYHDQLSYYMSYVVPLTAITSATDAELNPTPYTSALIDYRIEMGSDMSEGGGLNATYSQTILQGHGIADTANSFYAIEKLVYKDKSITLKKLVEVLNSNWNCKYGQELRAKILNLPKYGNDIDDVDKYAVIISNMFAKESQKYTPWRGGKFGISLQGLTANISEGETVGATPDGRVATEALSDNVSPHAGSDKNGPTSTLKSVSKIDHSLFVNGNILNLRFHPTALTNSFGEFDGIRSEKFVHLIKTFLVNLKGSQVQFNIASGDMLKKAQLSPDDYRDLVVKVAGYSAYFVTIDKALQDQIIERTEHII